MKLHDQSSNPIISNRVIPYHCVSLGIISAYNLPPNSYDFTKTISSALISNKNLATKGNEKQLKARELRWRWRFKEYTLRQMHVNGSAVIFRYRIL